MYRELTLRAPGAACGTKPVQLASGVAVGPVRTPIASVVPAGALAVHWIVCQATGVKASKTRETNVPLAVYGVMRIQSTNTTPPKGLKSLAATGRSRPGTAI